MIWELGICRSYLFQFSCWVKPERNRNLHVIKISGVSLASGQAWPRGWVSLGFVFSWSLSSAIYLWTPFLSSVLWLSPHWRLDGCRMTNFRVLLSGNKLLFQQFPQKFLRLTLIGMTWGMHLSLNKSLLSGGGYGRALHLENEDRTDLQTKIRSLTR